ncbi:MAG: DNA polymerase II large subunit [archaeon]
MTINKYFKEIEDKVKVAYSVAEEARKKGLDPKSVVEIPLATSLAERAVNLIATVYPQLAESKISKRIIELEKEHGSLDPAICLIIAEEIAKEKFCKFKDLHEAIDAGIRVGMAYILLGVVSSPIEGYTEFKVNKTRDSKDYFTAYYSGPIRSAGGTGAAFSLVIIDYLREIFGYDKYDPSEEEIKRVITELYDYHERVTNLQYLPVEKEIEEMIRNLPIQIAGDPSVEREVSNYKDLERVDTNYIRSGLCLVIGEGIIQKAPKILRMVSKLKKKGFKLSGWDFLEKFCELQKKLRDVKKDVNASAVYIQDLVAGRPVLGHPSRSGGFRMRYGRGRVSGYSALSIHPETMYVLNDFIATGTQLKTERPTKGTAISACNSIDGPIVKLNDGSVKKFRTKEDIQKYNKTVSEIIYVGDILVPYGDFINRNHILMPAGYVEQIWFQELKKAAKEKGDKIDIDDIYNVSLEKAMELSKKYNLSLHPNFIYYWTQISYKFLMDFLDWFSNAHINKKIIFPFNKTERERFRKGKRALELLGVEHDVTTENVVLGEEDSKALLVTFGLDPSLVEKENYSLENDIGEYCKKIRNMEVIDIINLNSEFRIRDKAGTFVGARMGRPEKAKLRKLVGSPNVLFPVGEEGGRLRSMQEAVSVGTIKADFPIYYCKKCETETIYFICETCKSETEKMNYCRECKQKFSSDKCPYHTLGQGYVSKRIDSKKYYDAAVKHLGLFPEEMPKLVKGVRGTSNKEHVPENLAKGLLRAFFGLNVNKDGTIRFDATELPITHFKPKEIETSVEKLIEMDYKKDIFGKGLENDNQILEIKPHDLLLPACPESMDEKADDVFVRITRFVDSLLVRFYGLKPFYNIKSRDDLVGHLVACIAPHNCACVAGRIIGFSKSQTFLASPYIHAAMRRDCDGDEAAMMLLLDMLLNFSREYLPSHRGGTQDAPLVLNARIRAGEVDDMLLDIDIVRELPLELYEAGDKFLHPSEVKIERIKDRLGKEEFTNLWYEYETDDINEGVLCSAYKKLGTMAEKVACQMNLAEKIRAVDTADVARLVIERHFIRDIRGNLRKFSQQVFRCSTCNEKYRRPPLAGKCIKCNGKIIFTISQGSIVKYLQPAIDLSENFEVPAYVRQSLDLTKSYIESVFGRETEKQEALGKWM